MLTMSICLRLHTLLVTCLLTVNSFALEKLQWADVVVYGDSPSAFIAAIELAESRHDVLLVSPVAHIGGMMVEGLGNQDVDSRSGSGAPIGGLAAEFYLRVARAYTPGTTAPRYNFEPKIAEAVIDAWLVEKSVRQLRGKRISEATGAVRVESGKITSFLLEDGTRVAGKVFIDGTVEGDLMAFSGVTYAWGREGNAKYGENTAGVINPSTKDQYNVNVDPYVVPGNPASGVITGVQNETVGVHGSGDDSAMGFCLRLPLTKNPANKIPITAPPGYQASDYELYRRFLAAGGTNDWLDGPGAINSSTTTKLFDLGSWHNLSGNLYGRNHAYPDGSYATRQQIYEYHRSFTQGLIYFLSNDPSVPAAIRNEWSRWGLPADEFTDNGGWPRRLYVRCARRMISDYVITEADVRQNPTGTVTPAPAVADPIGLSYWPVDLHSARTVIRAGSVYNEGAYFDLSNYRPFGIPYRSIIPKRTECTNLLVPSALSSSYAGYGAVRLEWTFMVLGQSAAIAAALALDGNIPVQDVSYDALKILMLARAQRLSLASAPPTGGAEIILDNTDTSGVAITGSWSASSHFPGFYGSNYITDGNTDKGTKTIRFTPNLPRTGEYAVYTRWNSDNVRATNVPMQVVHAGGTANLTINQQQNGNTWNLLGTWTFASGTAGSLFIQNAGTNGFVIADAVRFVEILSSDQVSIASSKSHSTEDASQTGRVIVHRDGNTLGALTVNLDIGGTAKSGDDYIPIPTTVTIPTGSASAMIEVQPLADSLVEGSETVIISVMPGSGYQGGASASAVVAIADPPYDQWRRHCFNAGNMATAGMTNDPDGDGFTNLMEFALAGDPVKHDIAGLAPEHVVTTDGGGQAVDYNYWRRRDLTGFMLFPETSTDLVAWSAQTACGEVVDYNASSDIIRINCRFAAAVGTQSFFVRLKATAPETTAAPD